MASSEQQRGPETDDEHCSQPVISAVGQAAGSGKAFLKKTGIAARLLVKEIYRRKLKWFDLRRADYQLGKKAYESGLASEQTQLISRLDGLGERLAHLRQSSGEPTSTIGQKAKASLRAFAKAVQIGWLKLTQRRTLKQLGASLRQEATDESLEKEKNFACVLVNRISSLNADIGELAPQTYPWARRPLLLASLLVVLVLIGFGSMEVRRHQLGLTNRNPRTDTSGSLSQSDLQGMLAQGQRFSEETDRRQEEAARREAQATAARIAAAARTYQEQAERERLEREKKARERELREEQTRLAEAERERQQGQIAAVEEVRLERERLEAEKLSREKAEREQAEAERAAAAERARVEEEKRFAQVAEEKRQREEDERAAQKAPASQLIAKSDLEAIMGLAMLAPEDRKVEGILTKKQLPGVEEASSCFFASTSPNTKGVMITVRYLSEKDEDQVETVVRKTMGKREFASPDLFFAYIPTLGYGGFFYRDLYCKASDSIFVFKPTLRGCTLLQVGIDGAPSEESSKNIRLWHEHMVDRETKIALKILGPPRARVARYEERHPEKEEEKQQNYLPDIPGVDANAMRFFNGMLKGAAKAEADNVASSKRIVAASGETKRLCPKCGGTKKMVQHTYNSGPNPYRAGTLGNALHENGRDGVNIVNCDECGGTGVVDAR
jgi:chemotaxis protein histidine kinase CheA